MTDDTMPLLDALLKRGGGDFMKELAEEVLGRLMTGCLCREGFPLRPSLTVSRLMDLWSLPPQA